MSDGTFLGLWMIIPGTGLMVCFTIQNAADRIIKAIKERK